MGPRETPQRDAPARFGARTAAKCTLEALLEPLFRQFLEGVLGSSMLGVFRSVRHGGAFEVLDLLKLLLRDLSSF